MDTIIYNKNQYRCYWPIRSNCIVACGKSNLTSNDIENIRLSHSLFQSLLHFKGYQSTYIANTYIILCCYSHNAIFNNLCTILFHFRVVQEAEQEALILLYMWDSTCRYQLARMVPLSLINLRRVLKLIDWLLTQPWIFWHVCTYVHHILLSKEFHYAWGDCWMILIFYVCDHWPAAEGKH